MLNSAKVASGPGLHSPPEEALTAFDRRRVVRFEDRIMAKREETGKGGKGDKTTGPLVAFVGLRLTGNNLDATRVRGWVG